jgi:hypothetical protein
MLCSQHTCTDPIDDNQTLQIGGMEEVAWIERYKAAASMWCNMHALQVIKRWRECAGPNPVEN